MFVGRRPVVDSEHGGLRRSVDIRIEEAHASAVRRQRHGEVRGNRALSYSTLAGRNGYHVLNALGLGGIRHGRAGAGRRGRVRLYA